MPLHTILLRNRTDGEVQLTPDEAFQLYNKGFRFSVFRPEINECRLSLPLETTINMAAGTITIHQPEGEAVFTDNR